MLALSAVEPLRGQGPGWASFLVDEGSGPRRRNYLWPSSPKMHQALNSAPPTPTPHFIKNKGSPNPSRTGGALLMFTDRKWGSER